MRGIEAVRHPRVGLPDGSYKISCPVRRGDQGDADSDYGASEAVECGCRFGEERGCADEESPTAVDDDQEEQQRAGMAEDGGGSRRDCYAVNHLV